MPFSLIELLRKRYLDTIQSVKPSNGRWKILVLDKHSQPLINGVLKTFEILELGVQQIDLIEKNRNPSPNLDALYIVAPTAKNVDRIISDFCPHGGGSSKKGAPSTGNLYAGAHMFFIDALDDLLVNRFTSSPAAPFLRQLIELFTNISADEPNVYTLRPPNPRSLITLYAPPPRSPQESLDLWEDEVSWISKSLINLFATLGEKPYIRYYNPSTRPLGAAALTQEHLCKTLASRLQKDLADYCASNDEFPPVVDPPRPRATMFIVERAMDLFSPLLHEFTYQSMCHDLLEITDGNKYCYSYKDQSGELEEKEVTLGEEDKVWIEVRHMHMKDALDKLINDFKNYASEHGHLTNANSLNDMKDMLASLPHLKESKEKLSLHLSMAETCMELFEKQQLMNIASVEQCCSTGMTAEGRTPKTIVEEMVPLLDDRSVSTSDKLRIVALYVLYRDGVPDEDRRRLYQHARLSLHEMDAVNNMVFLGANVGKDSGKKQKALFKQPVDENAYDISRFQPLVKLMLQDAVANKLDLSTFPYMGENPNLNPSKPNANSIVSGGAPTSLRSAKPSWQRPRTKAAPETRERMIVFVAGGLTYAEVRAAYEISEKHSKDVVIGSTHIYTPKKFIADLASLDRGGSSQGMGPSIYEPKSSSRPSKPKQVEPRDRLKASEDRYAHEGDNYSRSQPVVPQSLPSRRDYPPSAPSTTRPPPNGSSLLPVPSSTSVIGITPIPSPSIGSNASINSGKVEKDKKKGFFSRSKK